MKLRIEINPAKFLDFKKNAYDVLFCSEYDPSQLRTTTAGKLVRYLVENGSHVDAGQAYAEMEVMKVFFTLFVFTSHQMYLPLTATEPGKITHSKPEGAVLEAGLGSISFSNSHSSFHRCRGRYTPIGRSRKGPQSRCL